MIKVQSSIKSNRRRTTTITFFLALSVAAFVASGVSYGAKLPSTTLDAAMCTKIGGSWTTNTCTIQGNGVANQPFTVSNGVTLDVKGSLTINSKVANSGSMIVENASGVPQGQFDSWITGVLVNGALNNSGSITIQNTTPIEYDGTDATKGLRTVGLTVGQSTTDYADLNAYVMGSLTNSGTITIQNTNDTRGLENLGTIINSASGTITVANNGSTEFCVGIYNRRNGFPGRLTNEGTITISNAGYHTFGLYTVGYLTNSGVLTVNSLTEAATGIYNAGSFVQTSTGKYTNNHGTLDVNNQTVYGWGNVNNSGTMINFGTTYVNGTFLTLDYAMINYGTIYSSATGAMVQGSGPMLNYGTIYNKGLIYGGKNFYICLDQEGGTGC